jgi:hypothetical protein
MKKILFNAALMSVTGSLLFTACKKDNETIPLPAQEAQVAVSDYNTGTAEFDDILAIAEEAMQKSNLSNARVAGEDQVSTNTCGATIHSTKNGDGSGILTIDFGTEGLTCSDGRVRKGKVIVSFTGKYRENGKKQTITLENYRVNGHQIEGTKELTHTWNQAKVTTVVKVKGAKIHYTDGTSISWDSDRVHVWDSKGTVTIADDDITITGKADGITREGIAFDATIDNQAPLLLTGNCFSASGLMPVKGILRIKPKDMAERVVDYGSGECDRTITVTVNARSAKLTIQ